MITRREFITKMSVGFCCLTLNVSCQDKRLVRFAVVSDVHKDLQADAEERLQAFIDAATAWKPDFIVQLGDLSHGDGLTAIKSVWERFPGKRYSVLGNHDMDHSTKAIVTEALDMPSTYYSYDLGGIHFVVLDLNYMREDGRYVDFEQGNYFKAKANDRDLISPDELAWLKADLEKTDKPTVVFSHQGLDDVWMGKGCPNQDGVRALFQEINKRKEGKVIACFCGHHHIDTYTEMDGVHYFQINSASFFWTNASDRFSNGHMIEYKNSLYALVTIDLDKGQIMMEGVQSEFLPPVPTNNDFENADKVYPFISDKKINL